MKRIVAATLVVTLTGCAGANYRPVVDSRVSPANYETDVKECQQYAAKQMGAAEAAAVGAVLGALIGLAVNKNFGVKDASNVRFGAAVGALGAAGHEGNNQHDIIRNCMRGRGYSVLN